jgi:hypothetical protein
LIYFNIVGLSILLCYSKTGENLAINCHIINLGLRFQLTKYEVKLMRPNEKMPCFKPFYILITLMTGMLWIVEANACCMDPMLFANGDPLMNMTITNNYLINQTMINQVAVKPAPRPVATTLAPPLVGKPKAPAKLAASLRVTTAQRANIIRAFDYSYTVYVKLEQALRIPRNDVAGALAAYIGGNYAAYNNVSVSDPAFIKLVNQMRGLLLKIPAFKNASGQAKRELYEQWAIGGMFTYLAHLERKQKLPNNAVLALKIKTLAKANLEKFLRIPVGKLRITSAGLLVLR